MGEPVSRLNLDDRTDSGSVKSSGFDLNCLSRGSDLEQPKEDAKHFKSNSDDSLTRHRDGFHQKSTVNNDVVSSNNSSLDDSSGKTGSELEDSLSNLEVNGDPEPLSLILDDPSSISDVQQNLEEDDFYDYEHFKDPLEEDSPGSEKPSIGLTLDLQEHFQEAKVQSEEFNNGSVFSTAAKDSIRGKLNTVSGLTNQVDQVREEDPDNFSLAEKDGKDQEYATFTSYQFGGLLRETAINEINYDTEDTDFKQPVQASFANFSLSFDDSANEKSNLDCTFVNSAVDVDRDVCRANLESDYVLDNSVSNVQQSNDFSDSKTAVSIEENCPSSPGIKEVNHAITSETGSPSNVAKSSYGLSEEIDCDFSDFQDRQTFYTEEPMFQNGYAEDESSSPDMNDKAAGFTNKYVADFRSSLPNLTNVCADEKFREAEAFTPEACATPANSAADELEDAFEDYQMRSTNPFETFQSAFNNEADDDDFGDFADFASAPVESAHTNVESSRNIEESSVCTLTDDPMDDFDDFADFESSAPVVERPTVSLKETICRIENKNVSLVFTIFCLEHL